MKSLKSKIVQVSLLTALVASMAAQAQNTTQSGMAGMSGMSGMGGMDGMAGMHGERRHANPEMSKKFHEKMVEHRKNRLSKLHEQLKLRSDQEAAWTKFSEAIQTEPNFQEMHKSHEQAANLTTPQRLDKMDEMHKAHNEMHQKKVEAIRQFYGQLDSAQQKTFDNFPLLMPLGRMHDGKFAAHERMTKKDDAKSPNK